MLTQGQRIGGFLVHDLLGRGAMGEVYRAEQLSLKRPVAIKRIAEHLLEREDALKRFEREAQTLARVNSPYVVSVYEFGQFSAEDGSKHWLLVMELVEGATSLRKAINGPMDWRLATSVVWQAAQGLAAAAEREVVHRDIKPDNIMLTTKGVAKLTDFGLAKAMDATGLTIAQVGMGTPLFMAPEAWEGEFCPQSDLYSLGISWFQLLTGNAPFKGDTFPALMRAHQTQPPPNPLTLIDTVPEAVVKLCYRCLEKKPADRPSSAAELVAAIDALNATGLMLPRTVKELVAKANGNEGRTLMIGSDTRATMVAGGGTAAGASDARTVVDSSPANLPPVDRNAATIAQTPPVVAPGRPPVSATAAPTIVGTAAAATVWQPTQPSVQAGVPATAPSTAQGATAPSTAVPVTGPSAPATKRGAPVGLIVGVAVLVLAAAAGTWFALGSKEKPAAKPEPGNGVAAAGNTAKDPAPKRDEPRTPATGTLPSGSPSDAGPKTDGSDQAKTAATAVVATAATTAVLDDAKRKADEEAKTKAAAEAKRKADEAAKVQAEKLAQEEKSRAEAEAKRQQEEAAKRKADEDAKAQAEKLAQEEKAKAAKLKADEDAKRQAEDAARRKAAEEAALTSAAALRIVQDDGAKAERHAAAGEWEDARKTLDAIRPEGAEQIAVKTASETVVKAGAQKAWATAKRDALAKAREGDPAAASDLIRKAIPAARLAGKTEELKTFVETLKKLREQQAANPEGTP